MKKSVALIVISSLLLFALPFIGCGEQPVRIHIRANSNSDEDQAVKYIVRDKIVECLSSVVGSARSRNEAYRAISLSLCDVKKTADEVLRDCGFTYKSNARLAYELFPERDYGDVTYPSGYYDALIVELGSGKGDNWWCVAYPPLCFYGNDTKEFEYKSLIAELLGL